MSTAATSPLVEALDAQANALAEATPALAPARALAREAALAHDPGGPPEERANVTLWEEGGAVEGALLWASGPSGAAREVWGRRFVLR